MPGAGLLEHVVERLHIRAGDESAGGNGRRAPSGQNAYKGGTRPTLRALRRALRKQKKALASL